MLEDTMFIVGGDDSRAWCPRTRSYLPQAEYAPIIGDVCYVATESEIDEALRGAGLAAMSPLPPREISALEFRRRFTDAERLAIHTAALTVPQVAMWLADAAAAQTIDLLHPEAIAGVDGLISAGLISPARKDAILARVWPE